MAFLKIPQLTKKIVDRFWKKVKILPSGCWVWRRASIHRYPSFFIEPVRCKAHRIAYAIYYLTDPAELCVLHRCDNTKCVNPLHLFLGTQPENVADMIAKGRDRFNAKQQNGEMNTSAKLTEGIVRDIRLRSANGEKQLPIAQRYSISFQHVSDIVRRKCWKHI